MVSEIVQKVKEELKAKEEAEKRPSIGLKTNDQSNAMKNVGSK